MLSDVELRERPQATLDAICDFLRLPRIDVSGAAARDGDGDGGGDGEGGVTGVERALDAAFPSFGARTGWRLSGGYAPMSREERALLDDFYAPHNRALAAYLGRDVWRSPSAPARGA